MANDKQSTEKTLPKPSTAPPARAKKSNDDYSKVTHPHDLERLQRLGLIPKPEPEVATDEGEVE